MKKRIYNKPLHLDMSFDEALKRYAQTDSKEIAIHHVSNHAYWRGAAGRTYDFQLHPIGTTYADRPGIFILCRRNEDGDWLPIFVGETDSFARELTPELESHPAWECIIAADPTHVGTLHWTGSPTQRGMAFNDLLVALKPPCNI